MEENLYAANPEAAVVESSTHGTSGLSQKALEALYHTKPWLSFLAVMGFIFVALSLFATVIIFTVSADTENPLMIGLGVGYLFGSLFMLYIASKFMKFSRRIGHLKRNSSTANLEETFEAQRSLWKSIGILGVLYVCVFMFAISASIAVPALHAVQRNAQEAKMEAQGE